MHKTGPPTIVGTFCENNANPTNLAGVTAAHNPSTDQNT